jgi:transposase
MAEGSSLAEYGLRGDQETFIATYVKTGSLPEAAKACGRREDTVKRWLKQPKVHQAVQAEVKQRLNNGAVAALNTLRDLMENAEDDKTRMAAARDLLDRAGYKPEHMHTSADRRSADANVQEMMGRIKELCQDLGIANPTTIDVTPGHAESGSGAAPAAAEAPAPPTPDDEDPLGEAPARLNAPQDTKPAPKPEPAEADQAEKDIIDEIDVDDNVEDDTDVTQMFGDI